MSAGSSVGIATDYGLYGSGSISFGNEIFCPSRPALRPTQTPVQWVPWLSQNKVRNERAAEHSSLLLPRYWKRRAITLPNPWATSACIQITYLHIPYRVHRQQLQPNAPFSVHLHHTACYIHFVSLFTSAYPTGQ